MPESPKRHKPVRPKTRVHKMPEQSWGKGRGGHRWRRLRQSVFERDGFECQICKAAGRPRLVTLHGPDHGVCDHIMPKSQGGTDDPDNLQCICQACDKRKTARESRATSG